MPMNTGSDTRIYNPRSESMLGYSKDEDYRYGIGDPKSMEEYRDKKQAEKEAEPKSDDLPHLQIEVPKPAPKMPPMMPEEEEPEMSDQFNEGQQFGAMTGMPDMGNLSIGNATGTMPQPGGTLMTGEPMEDAWSTLLKGRELKDFIQQYPDIKFQSQEVFDSPLSDVPLDYGVTTHGSTSYLNPVGDNARSRTMNPQRMDILQRFLNRSKAKPKIIQQVHGNVENPYFVPPGMKSPPLEFENSNPNFENEDFYVGAEYEEPITQEMLDEHFRRYNIQTGESMEDAWSTLMKSRLDKVKGAKDQSWKQPQYETQPGGADITTANTRRAKLQSRYVQPSKKRGLDRAPLSVHRSHLGIATKQPLRLFPQKYGQQMGSMARRKLMGNIPTTPAGHAMGPETTYSPKSPKVASGAGLPLKEPRPPMMRGQAFAKSKLELIKQDLEELKKKDDYMRFAQIRRLLRQLKNVAERQERRLKASAGPGEVKESGHREGQDSTTRPEGATEDMENDPKNWGAPSTIFAARGSGRVG